MRSHQRRLPTPALVLAPRRCVTNYLEPLRLGLHGQVRLDLSWPGAIYTPMLLRRLAFPDFCEPCLPKFVFGVAVVATLLVAAPAAHAACRSPKNICKHFDDCLQRTSDPIKRTLTA